MEFANLCEFFPKGEPLRSTSGKVVNSFKNFFKVQKPGKIAISLSGGVDSMVSLWIMCHVFRDYCIEAIHINYQNRETCDAEVEFLKYWCEKIGIKLHVYSMTLKRDDFMKNNRNFYERETLKLRFEQYRKLKCPILLGHNYDDVLENIITNISSSSHKDNLKGMSEISEINNVCLYRPMLNISKKDIIAYAKRTNIPYLKDSTPVWSRRGKLRDTVIPTLNKIEPTFLKNLVKLVTI